MNQVEIKKQKITICSYALGLLTILILGKALGDNGIAYLAVALECFFFLWAVIGGSLSKALGKMLRGRRNRNQYKNVAKLRRDVMIFQILLGLAGSVLLVLCANPLAEKVFRMPYSGILIMLFAPTLFLRTISTVLLGYFQGNKTELPSVISVLLRQMLILGLGILLGNQMMSYGGKISALLGVENVRAMYGGLGVVIAICLSELPVLVFLLLAYRGSTEKNKENVDAGMKTTDSFRSNIGILYSNRSIHILIQMLTVLPLLLGLLFFQKSVVDVNASAMEYGAYFGKYLPMCGICILLICAPLISNCARVAGGVRKDEKHSAKGSFQAGIHIAVVHSLFWTAFLSIMSGHLLSLLGADVSDYSADMLRYGSFLIFLGVLLFYITRILLSLGGKYIVMVGLGIANVLFVILTAVMLNVGKLGIMSLVYAGLGSMAVYIVLMAIKLYRMLRAGIRWLQELVIPIGAACVVGLMCSLLEKAATPHLGEAVTLLACLVPAILLYWLLLLFLRSFQERELSLIPGGRLILSLGQLLRVF